jgi:peptidoglycan/xylan/chitin deacetylase (PgdA/CDA1 family)
MASAAVHLPWPEGRQGAVSLTFDDGRQSQLDIAVRIMDEFSVNGSFYLNPRGDDWRERLAPWRAVGLNGHELGNHTMRHTCSRSFASLDLSWANVKGLENTTAEEMAASIAEADRRLSEFMPEQRQRSFAYPCYLEHIGQGPTRQSYVPLVAKYHPAGRGKGELANHPALADLHYLTSWPIAGWMSGKQLVEMVENSVLDGRWVILTFHDFQEGPAGDWVPGSAYHEPAMPAANYRQLCEHLAENHSRLWTGTVVEIAQHLIAWRAGLGL